MSIYKNLVVNETDGLVRYNLVDRAGGVAAADVLLVPSSQVIQQGDAWGAREANTLLAKDDAGTPMLALDGGTY